MGTLRHARHTTGYWCLMADIKNIRLTDFIQGLQEEDALDYPNNAVRAGSNVTLAETIQTRGGLSTVDSVGLPSGSEIMALAQVKFPTNEKTFLVAQVKSTVSSVSPIEIQPSMDLDLNTPTYREGLYLFGGTEDGSDGSPDREVSYFTIDVDQNGTSIFAIDFNVGLTDSTGNNGTGTELGTAEGYGVQYSATFEKDVYKTVYEGPYLYFPDADTELWAAAIQDETLGMTLEFMHTGTDTDYTKRWPVLTYYDGTYWYSAWLLMGDFCSDGEELSSFSNTRLSTYGATIYGDVAPYRHVESSFVWPEYFAGLNVFNYVAEDGYQPYIQGMYAPSGGRIPTINSLHLYGGQLYDVQVWVNDVCKLWLKFGDYGLTDLSGNMGDGTLSSGTYEEILQEDGSILLGVGQYIYFAGQPSETWDVNDEVVMRFLGNTSGGAYLYFDLDIIGNYNWTWGVSQYDAYFQYRASGEIAFDMECPLWNVPDGSIVASEFRQGPTEGEYGTVSLWELYASAYYPDTVPPTSTSYGLYAMPDTLPDTGA